MIAFQFCTPYPYRVTASLIGRFELFSKMSSSVDIAANFQHLANSFKNEDVDKIRPDEVVSRDAKVRESIRISQVRVDDAKENWFNGKSELMVRGVQRTQNCLKIENSVFAGNYFKRLKKKWIGEWKTIKDSDGGCDDCRYFARGSSSPSNVPICLLKNTNTIDFVFFEKDNSPQQSLTTACGTVFTFNAEQDPYGDWFIGWLESIPYDSYTENVIVNNIEFTGAEMKVEYLKFLELQ
jgi:hypothetical protein